MNLGSSKFFRDRKTNNYKTSREKPVKNLSARQLDKATSKGVKMKKAGATREDGRTGRQKWNGYEKGNARWFALREKSD